MKKTQLLLLALIIFVGVSCKKDPEPEPMTGFELPNASETYLYAKVDGEDFLIAQNEVQSTTQASLVTNMTGDTTITTLTIGGSNTSIITTTSLAFTLNGSTTIENFPLNTPMTLFVDDQNAAFIAGYGLYNVLSTTSSNNIDASSEDLSPNSVVITITQLDMDNNKISGSFSFSAKDEDTDLTHIISDGVFNRISF